MMILAFENDVMDISVIAGADMSANQYKFVKLSADNTIVLCSGTTDDMLGVLQNKPKSGEVARVRIMGVSRILVGASPLTYGTKVGTDANGTAVAKTADKSKYLGVVVKGAGAAAESTVLVFGVMNTISA